MNPDAYETYLRGLFHWNKLDVGGVKIAVRLFNEAIEIDPSYAQPYALLSQAYLTLANQGEAAPDHAYPIARAAAQKAFELDDQLAEAHLAMARVKGNCDWELEGYLSECRRAIELKPGYAEAHCQMVYALALPQGRFEEAIAAQKRARDLDPLSVRMNYILGNMLFWAGQYDEALEQFERTLEMSPRPRPHLGLSWVYLEQGKREKAIAELQKAIALGGESYWEGRGHLARAYALAGRRDESLALLGELDRLSSDNKALASYLPIFHAMVHTALGENDRALDWLEKAYQQRCPRLLWLKVAPWWEPLGSDARYAALVETAGFPPT